MKESDISQKKPKKNKSHLKSEKLVTTASQTEATGLPDTINRICQLNKEFDNLSTIKDEIDRNIRDQRLQLSVHNSSVNEINEQIHRIKKAQEEIQENNGTLEKLLERRKEELTYCKEQTRETTGESEKLKGWKDRFDADESEEMEYLKDTLYYARKLRLAVNGASENYLDDITDLFKASDTNLSREIEEANRLTEKKQSLEKRFLETRKYVEVLKEENEILLEKLDRATVLCHSNDLAKGDHNNHCASNLKGQDTYSANELAALFEPYIFEFHTRPVVPRLDLSFLDSDTDSELESVSSSSSDESIRYSRLEDISDIDDGSKESSQKPNKNVFKRLFSVFK